MDVLNYPSLSIVCYCYENVVEFYCVKKSGIFPLQVWNSVSESNIESVTMLPCEDIDTFQCIVTTQETVHILYCAVQGGGLDHRAYASNFDARVVKVTAHGGCGIIVTSTSVYVMSYPLSKDSNEVTFSPCIVSSHASMGSSTMLLSSSHASSIKLYLDNIDFIPFRHGDGGGAARSLQGALICQG